MKQFKIRMIDKSEYYIRLEETDLKELVDTLSNNHNAFFNIDSKTSLNIRNISSIEDINFNIE